MLDDSMVNHHAIHQKWLAQGAGLPMTYGHCEACDAVIGGESAPIKGYASGCELGLCGVCADFVNTPSAMEAAAIYLDLEG